MSPSPFGTLSALLFAVPVSPGWAAETDVIPTSAGDLRITFVGHGTLVFAWGGKVIHVDPWTKLVDYARLPKADLILITHAHGDHLDPAAIAAIKKPGTEIVVSRVVGDQVPGGRVLANGETATVQGFKVEAVPAYNLVHLRGDGVPYHPKGEGNGYVITFGDTRVYVAGDTEDIPEMGNLGDIAVAFLPMNLPYTMTPQMAASAARVVHPKILYPYHFGETDTAALGKVLTGSGIEVRVRAMK